MSVVVVGMGEVNTGRYFGGEEDMAALKACLEETAPGASWIHVDGGTFVSYLQYLVLEEIGCVLVANWRLVTNDHSIRDILSFPP